MAVTIRQGLEARDSVMSVYDPCPVVLYDSGIGSLYNYRYVINIQRVVGGYTDVAVIKRFPNAASCGTFDLSQVLRLAVQVGAPSDSAISTSTNPCSSTNNSDYFRIRVGSESSATEDGAVTLTYDTDCFVHAFAGRFFDEFTSYNDDVLQDYVMASSKGQKWLTNRKTTDSLTALGLTFADCYVVPINKGRTFTMSYMSTDVASPYNTDAMKLRVQVGTKTSMEQVAEVNITNQNVDIATSYPPVLSDGGLIRDVHIGFPELTGYSWASALQGFRDWTYMSVELVAQSDGSARSLPIIFKALPECDDEGLIFKYLNNLGGYDYLLCQGFTQQTTEYTRQTYTTSTGNWQTADGTSDATNLLLNDPTKRKGKSEVTSQRKTFSTNTGYLDANDNDLVHGLLASKRVYCNKFVGNRTAQSNTFYPVNITNSSMRAMFQEVDKLIDYTIEFQYANPIRPSV